MDIEFLGNVVLAGCFLATLLIIILGVTNRLNNPLLWLTSVFFSGFSVLGNLAILMAFEDFFIESNFGIIVLILASFFQIYYTSFRWLQPWKGYASQAFLQSNLNFEMCIYATLSLISIFSAFMYLYYG